jgi:hypothetical protein
VPGSYSLTFWAQASDAPNGCHGCCVIQVAINETEVSGGQNYQLSVPPNGWGQFTVSMGAFVYSTTVQVGISQVNCVAQNLWLDDFGLVSP